MSSTHLAPRRVQLVAPRVVVVAVGFHGRREHQQTIDRSDAAARGRGGVAARAARVAGWSGAGVGAEQRVGGADFAPHEEAMDLNPRNRTRSIPT